MPLDDLHNLAVLSSEAGLEDDARRYYQLELDAIQRQNLRGDAGDVYIALGEQSQASGFFSQAEADYKSAIAKFDHSAGPVVVHQVIALDDLGWLYVTWGRLDEGTRLLDEGYMKAARSLALDDPLLIRHLDTQAAYRTLLGQYTEAKRLWERALKIREKYYGPQARQYDNILMHLGQASVQLGDFKTAQEMFQRYLTIEAPVSGSRNDSKALALAELGHLLTQQRMYSDAQLFFAKALAIVGKMPEDVPLSRSLVFRYFADYLMTQHDWEGAVQRYRQSLALQQRVLGDTRVVASSMELLSQALRKAHHKPEAEQLTTEVRRIREEQPGLLYSQNTIDLKSLRPH